MYSICLSIGSRVKHAQYSEPNRCLECIRLVESDASLEQWAEKITGFKPNRKPSEAAIKRLLAYIMGKCEPGISHVYNPIEGEFIALSKLR